jgi:hypothetical protein
LKDRIGDQRGGSEWELIKIILQRTRLMSQSQLQKSHTNNNRQDNVVMDQLQVLGTIPRSTHGSTRKEARTYQTWQDSAYRSDCPPSCRGLSAREGAECPEEKRELSAVQKTLPAEKPHFCLNGPPNSRRPLADYLPAADCL